MRSCQIFMRLHFQQTALGTLKLKTQAPPRIQLNNWCGSGDNQFNVAVIKLIYQVNEAPRLIVLIPAQHWHITQQYRVIYPSNLDVIVLATRPITQLCKLKPDNVIITTHRSQLPAFNLNPFTLGDDDADFRPPGKPV